MEKKNNGAFGAQMEIDGDTGTRVLVFTAMTSGLMVSPEDCGDEDALREIQED